MVGVTLTTRFFCFFSSLCDCENVRLEAQQKQGPLITSILLVLSNTSKQTQKKKKKKKKKKKNFETMKSVLHEEAHNTPHTNKEQKNNKIFFRKNTRKMLEDRQQLLFR